MRFNIKLLVFAVLTLGLTGYVYFYEYQSSVQSEKDSSQKILQYDVEQISYFQLIRPDGKIGLQKSETGWQLLEPIIENADNDKISELLTSIGQEIPLATVKATDTAFTEQELSEYGLDKPALIMNFKNNAGVTTKIMVGSLKNFEGQSYVLVDGQKKVLLGSANWFARSQERLIDYRDKRIFRDQLAQVTQINLHTLSDHIELKREQNKWVSKQQNYQLDQSMVRDILKKISDSQIEEYAFEGEPSPALLKETEMDKAIVSIELLTDKGPWIAKLNTKKDNGGLYLLSDRPTYLAKVTPLIWETVATLTLDGLRDRTSAFTFAAEEVKKIYFKSNGRELNLIFNSGSWLMGPNGGPYVDADKAEVGSKIKRMHDLKISQFIDRDARSEFAGDNMLILKTDRDKLLLQLNWGPSVNLNVRGSDKAYYLARTQLAESIFAIDKASIEDISLSQDQLLTKKNGSSNAAPTAPAAVESPEEAPEKK